jgi:hypothetical protein
MRDGHTQKSIGCDRHGQKFVSESKVCLKFAKIQVRATGEFSPWRMNEDGETINQYFTDSPDRMISSSVFGRCRLTAG